MDRSTVNRIVSQPEVVALIAEYQTRLLLMVPRAIEVYEEALNSKDPTRSDPAATNIFGGAGVMSPRGLQGTIDDAKARHFDSSTKSDLEFAAGPGEFRWPPEPEQNAKVVPRTLKQQSKDKDSPPASTLRAFK